MIDLNDYNCDIRINSNRMDLDTYNEIAYMILRTKMYNIKYFVDKIYGSIARELI